MRGLVWTSEDHSSAVLGSPAGDVELSQLGYFSVKVGGLCMQLFPGV